LPVSVDKKNRERDGGFVKDRDQIKNIAESKLLILDGAAGTQLQARGMPGGACPELWCLENPESIKAVHRDYLQAGSDVVYTCTFGANRFKLSEYGDADVFEINKGLALLARQAVGDACLVAGDIGPTGRFIEPFGDVSFEEAVKAFKEQVRGLMEGGVDLFAIETMVDIQEARAALIAVRELSRAFTIVTMTFESSGRTLNGTDPLSALITLQSLGADAVGCNCSTGPEEMIPLIRAMAPYARVPLVVKPNAGLPALVDGKTVFPMSPEEFSGFGREFVLSGVRFLGGCCGTTPAHISALRQKTEGLPLKEKGEAISGALSSPRKTVLLRKGGPLIIIGERINPTGKKDLQAELSEGKMALVKRFAQEQARNGADLLDVNAGMPGIDEAGTLREMVKVLSVSADTPLCIDSTIPEAIEASLRIYPGRALINSISGEEGKLDRLLDIASRYGAMFILLPLTGKKLPKSAAEREAIVEDIYQKAARHGFSKDDIVVDALTMAVSADGGAALETLAATRWCATEFGARTVLGLSNVSFGLPERKWINAAYLAMAAESGLNLAIANPMNEEFMQVKRAADVLLNHDPEARAYIAHVAGRPGKGEERVGGSSGLTMPSLSLLEKVYMAILDGSRGEIDELIAQALSEGSSAQKIIDEGMIPGIREVGIRYENKTYFLPQLIASAEAMKKGFEHLEPLLKKEGGYTARKSTIILATVQGDIHDIGKNIVSLMLKNNGFEVVDLGKDVPDGEIIEAALSHKPQIIGLSALMTTTMVRMKEVVDMARQQGIACPFLVGGAVVTKAYADSIGAHYARDGVEAVKAALELLGEKPFIS
jgi:5-methyltetrahydrofolate--homocysteine methyltransferase